MTSLNFIGISQLAKLIIDKKIVFQFLFSTFWEKIDLKTWLGIRQMPKNCNHLYILHKTVLHTTRIALVEI